MQFINCVWSWITDHATVLSAVVSTAAAVVVAVFTVKLTRATSKAGELAEKQMLLAGRQADLAEKQHGLARLQFIADKRPRLRVRHLALNPPERDLGPRTPVIQAGHEVAGNLVLANVGGIEARITYSRCRVFWSQFGLPMDPPIGDTDERLVWEANYALGAGSSSAFPFKSSQFLGEAEMKGILHSVDRWKLYVIGMVRYSTPVFHPEHDVEYFFGFCRVYNLPEMVGGEGRFVAVDNPDYEYQD
jgi:hypothetical protein